MTDTATVTCAGKGAKLYYSSRLNITHTKHKWMGTYATYMAKHHGKRLTPDWWQEAQTLYGLTESDNI